MITAGVLDLSILDNPPDIYLEAMASERYFNGNNKHMSWASMNTEAWKGKIMGLESRVIARANTKKVNNTEAHKDGHTSTAYSNASTDGKDTGEEHDTVKPDMV